MSNNYTVNNKKLNAYNGGRTDTSSYKQIMDPVDQNGNTISLGDKILVITNTRYPTVLIHTVEKLTIDNTNPPVEVLGFKQLNGQYTTLYGVTMFLTTPDFCQLHNKIEK